MIALIAEKPSVAKDIARIIGATERNDGYLSGNGYMVTWAFGHLIQLAMPEAYGAVSYTHLHGRWYVSPTCRAAPLPSSPKSGCATL